jgi:hypothetical protein
MGLAGGRNNKLRFFMHDNAATQALFFIPPLDTQAASKFL